MKKNITIGFAAAALTSLTPISYAAEQGRPNMVVVLVDDHALKQYLPTAHI